MENEMPYPHLFINLSTKFKSELSWRNGVCASRIRVQNGHAHINHVFYYICSINASNTYLWLVSAAMPPRKRAQAWWTSLVQHFTRTATHDCSRNSNWFCTACVPRTSDASGQTKWKMCERCTKTVGGVSCVFDPCWFESKCSPLILLQFTYKKWCATFHAMSSSAISAISYGLSEDPRKTRLCCATPRWSGSR